MNYQDDAIITSIFFGILGLFLIYTVLNTFNISTVPIIDRDQIEKVVLIKGSIGMSRTQFIVHFKNEKGRTKKRTIIMPDTKAEDKKEIRKAIQIMEEEGLINKS